MEEMRLQRFMASCGVDSRRKCEQIILDGKVEVNGDVITALSTRIDPEHDEVKVEGKKLKFEEKLYFIVNKPKGIICSNKDERDRKTIIGLFPDVGARLHTVGRLDMDSEGLLILTNDGAFTKLMTHPSHQVKKRYQVVVDGALSHEAIEKLRKGVWLDGGKTRPATVYIKKKTPRSTLCEIGIEEGVNRQIRRMLSRVGYPVKKLTRTHIGGLKLGTLKSGQFRQLTEKEVTSLNNSAS